MKNRFSLLARRFLLGCEDQVLDFEDKEITIAKIVALGNELEYKGEEKPNINFSKGEFGIVATFLANLV
ncbi:hypothetical protein [Campylobacter sp. MIT 97-5078]|uniref:hypothetical protein n=1 Tax=Campylobacter sp. MIT 97-5078 TaxID=1548153 RepID=UPI0005142509|nr:hypothetical protein [Campylobacter sp. MIT 97-5078]KGI56133.1 hypothetical protein LR59_08625 [Campylobacter sp. MIT 97-5078]TQR27982.1 hypothetical protein DMB91_01745 [Campylobacter sp. MIT 97-5078]